MESYRMQPLVTGFSQSLWFTHAVVHCMDVPKFVLHSPVKDIWLCITFLGAAIRKYQKLGDLKQQKLIFSQFWKPES